jgi:DNA polymerase III alpha subunit (gram-positive type)
MITYVVCDIEADGPIPGPHSMMSLGAVAVNKVGNIFGEFEINFLPLKKAKPHSKTMEWFNKNAPKALMYCKINQVEPQEGMKRFGNWLLTLPMPRVMAAHPAPLDFMWVNWYIQTYLKDELEEPPFTKPFFDNKGQGAFDIKSYAAAVLKKDFTNLHRDTYTKDLHDNTKHTHKAIDDAREYAQLLIKLLNKN